MKFEKGKAVPLSTEEKIALALKTSVSGYWPDKSAWVRSLSITEKSSTTLDKGKERVIGSGSCTLGFKCLNRDAILMDKDYEFKVSLEDVKDELGLPDVKVSGFTLTEVPK